MERDKGRRDKEKEVEWEGGSKRERGRERWKGRKRERGLEKEV